MSPEIIASLLNFAVVVFIVWHFGRKPARDFLSTRSKTIDSSIQEGQRLSAEADRDLQTWEAKWRSVESEAKKLRDDVEVHLKKVKETGLAAAHAEAERIQKESRVVGQSEVAKAKEALRRELVHKSVDLAGLYLNTNLGESEKHQLVSDYVEILGNATSG